MDSTKFNRELDKKNIMIDKLRAELKDLRGKYEDLTKEYYLLLNQAEDAQKNKRRITEIDSDE